MLCFGSLAEMMCSYYLQRYVIPQMKSCSTYKSQIFGVALSILTLTLAAEGLGVLGPLTVRRANILMKGYYASDFLYILSLCFAKLSLVAYFYNIVVQRAQRRVVLGIGIFILVWTSASLIAIAFQCKLPSPWAKMTLNCYNSVSCSTFLPISLSA